MSERYSFSLTTFSPSGKLMQIEYAMKAVEMGAPAVGIKACNGVVLAVEKKFPTCLVDPSSVRRVECITPKIGMLYSGISPDFNLLVKYARRLGQEYEMRLGRSIPPDQLVMKVASVMQEFTQMGGVRPFGVSLLIAGWDEESNRPFLYQCDSAGTYFSWKATALGKNSMSGKNFLEKRYSDKLEVEDAVHTAILALKESFEGEMTSENIEIGICDQNGFRVLTPNDVKDYLQTIA